MAVQTGLIKTAFSLVAFLGLDASASAHYLWLERDAKSARLYFGEVIFKEPSAGEFGGQKYEAIRHRATLTVVQPGGISAKGTGGGASSAGMTTQPMMN